MSRCEHKKVFQENNNKKKPYNSANSYGQNNNLKPIGFK
jgi:hypothetical protein